MNFTSEEIIWLRALVNVHINHTIKCLKLDPSHRRECEAEIAELERIRDKLERMDIAI